MDTAEKPKFYAKLINDEFNILNLKNNSYFTTSYFLRCVEGEYEGRQFRLSPELDEIIIGSDESATLTIKDDEISQRHCRISRVPNTIYYTLEDLQSQSGTWKRISFFDDPMEIVETTHFKIFQNNFVIEVNHRTLTKEVKLKLFKITKELEEESIEIGKKDCMFELEMPFQYVENHVVKIQKISKRTFLTYTCPHITNEGFFYKIPSKQKVLMRAEDCFKIGDNTFKIQAHNWGVFNEIGDKFHQEDRYTIIDDLKLFDSIAVPFYAIYDGHGGAHCSTYLKTHFHTNLRFLCKIKNLKENESNFFNEFCKIIQEAIVITDINFMEKEKIHSLNQGSSCLCLFFIGNKVITCSLGESLGIVVKRDKEIYLNREHKPSWNIERERIEKKNGKVTGGKIFGALSVSRSFGDWQLKDPKKSDFIRRMFMVDIEEYLIENRADFRVYEIDQKEDQYIILTSSGLLEHFGKKKLLDYVSKFYLSEKINEKNSVKNMQLLTDKLRLEIINDIYADENNRDIENLTLMVIDLQSL